MIIDIMNDYCVYCHTSPSGKKYVGISCNPEKRWNSGKGYLKNYRFYRAIQKYGWENIQHEIIAKNLSEEEACEMESRLILDFHLTDFRYGYNLREGGKYGSPCDESRKKMSNSQIGNTNNVGHVMSSQQKMRISKSLTDYYKTHTPPSLGRHHSMETIQKLKARVITNETKEKMRHNHANVSGSNNPSARAIRMLSVDGDFIKSYPYATMASNELHIDLSAIIKCCKGKVKTCGGYKWEYDNRNANKQH